MVAGYVNNDDKSSPRAVMNIEEGGSMFFEDIK
jgi:hypothetical protein